jgi:hypothetical protein
MASLFANAKAIPAKKSAAKKSDKDEVQLTDLKQLAELDALIKALSAAKTTLDAQVKAEAFDHFFDEAQATAKRPDNFRGIDGIASASIEMRKRSTASALSDDEVKMFEAHGLTVEKAVSVQQLFGVNPIYATDTKLLNKVSKALENIVSADFFVVQEEKFKFVVTDETMEKAFSTKAPREIIEAISTMAIKPKLETTDIAQILKNVKDLIA